MRFWSMAGAWVTLVVSAVAGLVATLIASIWLNDVLAGTLGAGIAALAGISSKIANQKLEDSRQLSGTLRASILLQPNERRPPKFREVADPVVVGVHPAQTVIDASRSISSASPPYIGRDIDQSIYDSFAENKFTLVIGESTAGKSRTCFEAARSQYPDHFVIAPKSRSALMAAVDLASHFRPAVLWLDDIERYLGRDGLTVPMVTRLMEGRGIRLVASLRISEYERFAARAESALTMEDKSDWRLSAEVLHLANKVTLNRRWSTAERERARSGTKDPRILRALKSQPSFGVAEILAAGPELAREWENAWSPGAHPRGAALVAAVVDCRRVGITDPISTRLAERLHIAYLANRGGSFLRPESLADAWAWCLAPAHGASSLIVPASTSNQVAAFDYLIDLPFPEPIPPATWNTLLEVMDDKNSKIVAQEAYWRYQPAFHLAMKRGILADPISLANAETDAENYEGAIEILEQALHGSAATPSRSPEDERSLRHNIAFNYLLMGNVDEAEPRFQLLLTEAFQTYNENDEYIQVVKHNLASCTRMRGDLDRALSVFQEILEHRETHLGPDTLNALATRGVIEDLLAEMNQKEKALASARETLDREERVLGRDHRNVLHRRRRIAHYLAETGDIHSAVDSLQTLIRELKTYLGSDHADVREAESALEKFRPKESER